MNKVETSSYKNYLVQAFVYKRNFGEGRSHERLFDVSVRIGREGESASTATIYKLPNARPFFDLGDARRAGEAYAREIIDGFVPGSAS